MSKPFQSLKGQLLLDGGELVGSFFQRSVVLICEHNAEGAFGLILNRVMENKVGEMVVADLPERLRDEPLYLGGPMQPGAEVFFDNVAITPNKAVNRGGLVPKKGPEQSAAAAAPVTAVPCETAPRPRLLGVRRR